MALDPSRSVWVKVSEMLQSLAATIARARSVSVSVSLLLVPVLYELTQRKAWKQQLATGEA